jgi:E3 ubiquitin-protein ligase RAD18
MYLLFTHLVCSVCIRKFMQYRTSCPQCLAVVNEIELKNNRSLDEIIVVMRRLRGPLSQKLQGVQSAVKQDSPKPQRAAPSPLKSISTKPLLQEANAPTGDCEILMESPQRLPNSSFEASPFKTPHNSSGSSLLRTPSNSPASMMRRMMSPPRPEIKVRSLFNMMKSPVTLTPAKSAVANAGIAKKVVAMVNCPICQVEIPEASINIHIDRCLERSNQEIVAAIK